MSYVLVGILVLLLVAVFVTYLVMNATKRSGHATAKDDGSAAPGIGADSAPLGDTQQHAGQQDDEGATVGAQDADASGGTGKSTRGAEAQGDRDDRQDRPEGRFQRDPIGGEAEARPFMESER